MEASLQGDAVFHSNHSAYESVKRRLYTMKQVTVTANENTRSEVLLIGFTDGEILGIHTGSNFNPADPLWHSGIKPDDVHIDLMLTWDPDNYL